MISESVAQLVRYGLGTGLISDDDAIYARNRILDCLKTDDYEETEAGTEKPLEQI